MSSDKNNSSAELVIPANRKRRSSRNALKHGIFSSSILDTESRIEYAASLDAARKHYEPEDAFVDEFIQELAMVRLRKRTVVQAGSATIAKERLALKHHRLRGQQQEVWDRYCAGETAGGMLRPTSNPLVIQECIGILERCLDHIEKSSDFVAGDIIKILLQLYGSDNNSAAPDFFRLSVDRLHSVVEAQAKREAPDVIENIRKQLIELFNCEIQHRKAELELTVALNDHEEQYEDLAAMIPSQPSADLFIRYEAHLSREEDRIMNRLEREQRRRRGQAPSPTVNLNISSLDVPGSI